MRHNTTINILNDLIEAIIKINDKLYQLQMTTKLSKSNKYYQNCSIRYYIIKKDYKPFTNQYRDPINLNIIQKKKTGKKNSF